MDFVWNGDGKWVFKDRLCFLKIHPMNTNIALRFNIIPFKQFGLHAWSYLSP